MIPRLSLLMLIFAFHGLIRAYPQQTSAFSSMDTLRSGLYTIYKCGGSGNDVVSLLEQLYGVLDQVITDVDLAPPSAVYQAFFKNTSYAPFVKEVLTSIRAGSPIALSSNDAFPLLICVSAPNQIHFTQEGITKDLYSGTGCSNPDFRALYIQDTPFIALCPGFFSPPATPSFQQNNCLHINTAIDRFSATNSQERALADYQIYNLLHTVANFYICSSADHCLDAFQVNQCFWLNALDSSINAMNYQFYIANLQAQCRDLPEPRDRAPPGIDLNSAKKLLSTNNSDILPGVQAVYMDGFQVFGNGQVFGR